MCATFATINTKITGEIPGSNKCENNNRGKSRVQIDVKIPGDIPGCKNVKITGKFQAGNQPACKVGM